jgi:hypothetical protein
MEMEIKEQEIEIQERNKEIALMLNKKYENDRIVVSYNNVFRLNPTGETWQKCEYSSNWNWLIEVVDFINKTHNNNNEHRDLTYTIKYLLSGGYFPGATEPTPKRLMHSVNDLFLAVSDFAKCYNKK